MSEIKVSISCITYNHAAYIQETLDSFLMQKVKFHFEIVVHDDASTDNTSQILATYSQRFPGKLRYTRKAKNIGMLKNSLDCLNDCRGTYIALCEGDDYWTDPLKLQKQVDFLEQNCDFSGCAHQTAEVMANGIKRILGPKDDKILKVEDTFAILAPFHTSSFVFRRAALKLPTWLNRIFSLDMALFSIIASSGPIFCFDTVMSHYRIHPNGVTRSENALANYHKNRIKLIGRLNRDRKSVV